MATKLCDLDDWISGVSLQIEGCTPASPSGQKGLEETGASGSSPSHSLSWSMEWWLSPGCLKTRYCLGIHVTLTEKRGAAPNLLHTWMVPVVEDMLWHGRACLTEAIVTGPVRAILFYGRHSVGEGLSIGKVRDAIFTVTGAGTWVGKSAHLAANHLTIQKGWQLIAQAIMECWIGVRGPGHPCSHPTTPQAYRFYHGDESPWEECIKHAGLDHWPPHHKSLWGRDHDQWQRNPRLVLPQPPHLPLIMDSKMIGFQCWQPHQYHCSLTDQKVPGIPIMADVAGRLEAIWRSIYPSLKMRTPRTLSLIRVGDGTWLYTIVQGVKTVPSSPMPSDPCKDILQSLWGAPGQT